MRPAFAFRHNIFKRRPYVAPTGGGGGSMAGQSSGLLLALTKAT